MHTSPRALPLLCTAALLAATSLAQPAWTARTRQSPPPRSEHVLVDDAIRGRVVLFGGKDTSPFGDTWEWDGTRWLQRSPVTSPPARSNHGMAYDPVRGEVVLFSGSNQRADTWLWNGTTWRQATPATSPSARQIHAMTFDAGRGRVVLFGGKAGTVLQDDTWEWDGVNWQQVATRTRPPARWAHVLAYDPVRRHVVLFGGTASPPRFDDTWTYDGTDWTKAAPAQSPPIVSDPTLVWDDVRERMVLFGGFAFAGLSNDTWEWDGTDWTYRAASNPPPPRCCHGAAFDSRRGEMVMFGGFPLEPTTYTYQTTRPATFTTSGVGCAGAGGVPTLQATRPWIDDVFDLALGSIGPGVPLLIVGLSDTTWNGNGLPFDLGAIGFPGCSLRASMDLLVPGQLRLSAPIPPVQALAGRRVYFQSASLGPGNQLGLSPLGTALIGAR